MGPKTWFILADTSFPPDTEIQLGQIICNPRMPSGRLDRPLEIKEGEYEATSDQNREFYFTESRFTGGNLIAAFLSYINVVLFGGHKTASTHIYKIDHIQKFSFSPSDQYVLETLRQPGVRNYLNEHMFKKSLYMIVGIGIARGARVYQSDYQGRAWGAGVTSPGSLTGAPVDISVLGSSGNANETQATTTIPGEFVFAYRLRKCRYVKSQLMPNFYTHGTTMHDLRGRSRQTSPLPTESPTGDNVILEGKISGVDLDEKTLGLEDATVYDVDEPDEEQKCRCIILGDIKMDK